ncbi:3734_t:CDS:2 [Entrophospora sp. SA101]|nr:3734_t:CDS:2 [Entrophospora sp. SA101]
MNFFEDEEEQFGVCIVDVGDDDVVEYDCVNNNSEIYHEKQRFWLCGKHTLNNLFQCQLFTRSKLDEIAIKLAQDSINSGVNGSSNSYIDGLGNYDVNVLQAALEEHGLETQWFDSRKEYATNKLLLEDATVWNLDSKLSKPHKFLNSEEIS